MRTSILLPALGLLAPILALQSRTPSPTTPRSAFESRALVDVTGCVTLPIGAGANVDAPGIIDDVTGDLINAGPVNLNIDEQVCLCLKGGVVTEDSLVALGAQLFSDTGLSLAALGLTPDLAATAVADVLVAILDPPQGEDSDACPAGSFPANPDSQYDFNTNAQSCKLCTYTCIDPTPQRCNGECIPEGAPCASGVPGTGGRQGVARGLRYTNPDLLCATGLTACGLPKKVATLWGKVECLDTMSNVETCGGCEYPLPGRPKGIDCGSIDNVSSVNCVQGQCIIESCLDGYTIIDGTCVQL